MKSVVKNSPSILNFDLILQRLPKNDQLQAWDAADTLLLEHIAEKNFNRALLVNDTFGALACNLAAKSADIELTSWSDSWLAHKASEKNLAANQLDARWLALPSTELPTAPFDAVLIQLPKTMALLEQQLHALRPALTDQTVIVAAGMAKHIHRSTIELFEKIIGPSPTSLAKKKARLIFPSLDKSLKPPTNKSSKSWSDHGLQLNNLANVFSREKFDIGARFFIEQFAELPPANNIIDLGCGNGVLSICAAQHFPEANILGVDESYMAVASATENYQQNIGDDRARFTTSNCLSDVRDAAADLILCNPPFHQQHAVGDTIAWQMLRESHRQLQSGGELWVVGNRQLHYHSKLKRLFGGSRMVASNNKFVVLAARKR